jgi:hypothetical protein
MGTSGAKMRSGQLPKATPIAYPRTRLHASDSGLHVNATHIPQVPRRCLWGHRYKKNVFNW